MSIDLRRAFGKTWNIRMGEETFLGSVVVDDETMSLFKRARA